MEWKDDPDVEAEEADANDLVNWDSEGRWLGKCLDDGTGRNVYYVNVDGSRSRRQPRGYVVELLDNGDRRYYYRNTCIRCRRTKVAPIVFFGVGPGEIAFSLNLCDDCHVKTVPGTTRLRGNASAFYKANTETPKNAWFNLRHLALAPARSALLLQRARDARRATLKDSKLMRNKQRFIASRRVAKEYGIENGEHISWGYGSVFDEYFGGLHPTTHLPHGEGYKVYSDGSVYYGGFSAGERHSDKRGVWTRPSGSVYDGTWQFDQRHGKGTQIYPDGGRYEGEFAKGFEHGMGKKVYPDGSTFEGRFRFGRKDGPGTFIDKDGVVEKGTFPPDPKEKFSEKDPPNIEEEDNMAEEFFQPESLMHLAIVALAQTMHNNRDKYTPAKRLTTLVPEHLKSQVAAEFLHTMSPQGTKSFQENGPKYAFTLLEELVFRSVRITQADCQALMYFQGSNSMLKTIVCCGNNLDLPSIDFFCKNLKMGAWPSILTLDLGFNTFDISALEQLIDGVDHCKTMRNLHLASCQIKSNGFFSLSKWIASNPSITTLDLAFNLSEAMGAQLLAEALAKNTKLTSLNMRSNRIGTIGGMGFCEAMKTNKVLRVLCVADNGCGPELLALLSGRLKGGFGDVVKGVLTEELNLPNRYAEGRYDYFQRRLPDKFKEEK